MKHSKKKPALGDTVKDTVTGFSGVVVAYTVWLNGCERLSIQPTKLNKNGQPVESVAFDIQQLVVVKGASHAPIVHTRTGGDRRPVRRGQETPKGQGQ